MDQQTETLPDESLEPQEDPLNGLHRVMDEKGLLERTYHLVEGRMEGSAEDYQEGRLVRKFTLANGLIDGTMESYDAAGVLESTMAFSQGKLHGPCFYGTGKRVTLEMAFENGVQQGWMNTYHENGELQSCVQYQEGLMEGLHQVFDDKKGLVRTAFYVQGQLDGEVVTFYPDSKQSADTQTYKAGLLDGPTTRYDSKGRVFQAYLYKAGCMDGRQLEYHPPLGDKDPVLAREAVYERGELKSEKRYDAQGRELHEHNNTSLRHREGRSDALLQGSEKV
jgi:antitoxin component YwqK of YwqJK toxin-antitoxin module